MKPGGVLHRYTGYGLGLRDGSFMWLFILVDAHVWYKVKASRGLRCVKCRAVLSKPDCFLHRSILGYSRPQAVVSPVR